MIPRFKPALDRREISELLKPNGMAVEHFEQAFANTFEGKNAISFPYGRSALWALFKSLKINNAEIIQPAYTCVVVSHAIVLSGNIPRFIDIDLSDYNMNIDQVEEAINSQTRAIVITHLFGQPMDIHRIKEVTLAAEKRFGNKIWIIQDCAHSFGASRDGELVCKKGDFGLFGLNISKIITSVFGGMLTVEDPEIATRIRKWRDSNFHKPRFLKNVRRILYLLATYPAFNEVFYGIVYWAQNNTPLLDYLIKAYHLDGEIKFPPDYRDLLTDVEAKVGIVQLKKYSRVVRARRENAVFYEEHLRGVQGLTLPPINSEATYSHYVIRVRDRERILDRLARRGIQLGTLIDYSIPHMTDYKIYAGASDFPNSLLCSKETINLPVYLGLTNKQRDRIVRSLITTMRETSP